MKLFKITLMALLLLTNGTLFAAAPTDLPRASGKSVKEATQFCEKTVAEHCKTTTCPLFCEKLYERRRNKAALIAECKTGCADPNRCKFKLGGREKEDELDAQNREQVIACIAQERDPEGKVTGRRMEDWKDIQTPSWQRLMR